MDENFKTNAEASTTPASSAAEAPTYEDQSAWEVCGRQVTAAVLTAMVPAAALGVMTGHMLTSTRAVMVLGIPVALAGFGFARISFEDARRGLKNFLRRVHVYNPSGTFGW